MRVLFLDDMATRQRWFKEKIWEAREINPDIEADHATTALAAIDLLKQKYYDIVYLDHDLSDVHYSDQSGQSSPEQTGAEVTKFIAKMQTGCPAVVVVHSLNPTGAQNMLDILRPTGVRLVRWLFAKTALPVLF